MVEALFDNRCCDTDRRVVRNIEHQRLGLPTVCTEYFGYPVALGDIAAADQYVVTGPRKAAGNRASQTFIGPADQCDGHRVGGSNTHDASSLLTVNVQRSKQVQR